MQRRGDPLVHAIAAAEPVARLGARLEEGVLGTRTGIVSLVGAPPGLLPYLLDAAGGPLGLRWVVVFAHERDAMAFRRDAEAALGVSRVAFFPAPSLTPYQGIAPSLKVRREEFGALARLAAGEPDLLVVPARALYRILPAPGDFARRRSPTRAGRRDEPGPARRAAPRGGLRSR